MIKRTNLLLGLSLITSIILLIYSYLWVDLALVLSLSPSHPFLNGLLIFKNWANNHREILAWIYLLILGIMFVVQLILLFWEQTKKFPIKKYLIISSFIVLFSSLSYPFLSHDLFTYIFSSKILWNYGLNPYSTPPKLLMDVDFGVGFLRNIDNNYAYGPIALLYTLTPTIVFSGNRFISNYVGIKLMNAIVFYFTGYLLYKLSNKNKKVFSLWFFNPLLIVELLINSHNDLTMISLAIVGMFFVLRRRVFYSTIAVLASVLTKYISIFLFPIIFIKEKWRSIYFHLLAIILMLFLLLTKRNVQVWYYSWFYMIFPFVKLKKRSWMLIYLVGILLIANYFNFIKTGFWGGGQIIPFFKIWLSVLGALVIFNELNIINYQNIIKSFKK